jgi:hypothetical protein
MNLEIEAEGELTFVYAPLKPVPNEINFSLSPKLNYVCNWTAPLLKENADLCRASGYSSHFTFLRALDRAAAGIFAQIK